MPKLRPRCLLKAEEEGGHLNSVLSSARLQTDDAEPVNEEGYGANAASEIV